MPQAEKRLRDIFGLDDFAARKVLKEAGWLQTQSFGWIAPYTGESEVPQAERDACLYLIQEWDWGGVEEWRPTHIIAGKTDGWQNYKVMCDGEEVKHIREVNTKEGWAIQYVTQYGRIIMDWSKQEPQTVKIYGNFYLEKDE